MLLEGLGTQEGELMIYFKPQILMKSTSQMCMLMLKRLGT